MKLKGHFEDHTKDVKFPPVLVINVDTVEEFETINKVIAEEMFLRYRKPAPGYSKVVIETVGDTPDVAGIPVDGKVRLRLDVIVSPRPSKNQETQLDLAPFYSVTVLGSEKVIAYKIDKTEEMILDRRLIPI
jgi:hypothetical protein